MKYKLFVYPNHCELVNSVTHHTLKKERFEITGRQDPRIFQAIFKCKLAGFDVELVNV